MTETVKATRLEAHDVLAQLWEIADTVPRPNGVTACVYARQSDEKGKATPVCIVGQWLARQELDLYPLVEVRSLNTLRFSALTGWEVRDRGEQDTAVAELVAKIDAMPLTRAARSVLATVQVEQDNGVDWRTAVANVGASTSGTCPGWPGCSA